MTDAERKEWADLRNEDIHDYLFWHETPSVEEDFAQAIASIYYLKDCPYPDIEKLTRRIIRDHKAKK